MESAGKISTHCKSHFCCDGTSLFIKLKLTIWPVVWCWWCALWLVIDLDALFKGRFCCFPKDPLEDVETWAESVDKVLGCKGETLILIPQVSARLVRLTSVSRPFQPGRSPSVSSWSPSIARRTYCFGWPARNTKRSRRSRRWSPRPTGSTQSLSRQKHPNR